MTQPTGRHHKTQRDLYIHNGPGVLSAYGPGVLSARFLSKTKRKSNTKNLNRTNAHQSGHLHILRRSGVQRRQSGGNTGADADHADGVAHARGLLGGKAADAGHAAQR